MRRKFPSRLGPHVLRAVLTAVVVVPVVSGCGDRGPQGGAGDAGVAGGAGGAGVLYERGTTFAQDSMRDWLINSSLSALPEKELGILAVLGTPDSVLRLPVARPIDPMAYDTAVQLYYPGIELGILKRDANELLQSVMVTDSTYVNGPITVGTDTTEIKQLIGPPMLGGSRPGYVCGDCSIPNSSVRFDIVDGRVAALLFTFPA
jgi:hypothetical protein